jgi:hypothetical protein
MRRAFFPLVVACATFATSASAADLPPLPPPDPTQTPTQPQAPTQTQTQTQPQTQTQAQPPTQTQAPTDAIIVTAPPESPPPPPADHPDPNKRFNGFLYGKGGYAWGRLFDIAEQQGNIHVGGGAQNNKLAIYAYFDLLYGSTSAGLRAYDGSIGGGVDGRLRRFRLGGGAFVGYVSVRRTTFDSTVHAYSLGAFMHASADVYTFGFRDDHAVFVDATARGEGFIGGTTGQLVLTGGFRY